MLRPSPAALLPPHRCSYYYTYNTSQFPMGQFPTEEEFALLDGIVLTGSRCAAAAGLLREEGGLLGGSGARGAVPHALRGQARGVVDKRGACHPFARWAAVHAPGAEHAQQGRPCAQTSAAEPNSSSPACLPAWQQ